MTPDPDRLPAEFSDPRLVALYDALNPLGEDVDGICRLAASLSAASLIDLGCGTGLVTLELARRGHRVTGVDPSAAMLAVARAKPLADEVTWLHGGCERLAGLEADLVLMTSHVAQFFLDEDEWRSALRAVSRALNEHGHLVFDVRRLTAPPFEGWPTAGSRRRHEDTPSGPVEWWFQLLGVEGTRVRYELHYRLARSGETLVSANEIAFRPEEEIEAALLDAGLATTAKLGNWGGAPASAESAELIYVARKREGRPP